MFPELLTSKKQWIVWRFEQYEGDKKPRKVPYYVNGRKRFGKQGDEQDLSQLASFHEAKEAVFKNGYSGLGFALAKGDGLICIDIDSNADGEKVSQIISGLDSYTEVSPSGNGYHIWVAGETRTFKSNDVGIEVFCGAQFITMTGNRVDNTPFEVKPISEALLERLRVIVKGERNTQPKQREYTPVIDEAQKIESALAYISSDCGYHDWIHIGAAIYDALGPSGFSIWDYWSSKGSSYNPNEMQNKYDSFAIMTEWHAATIYKMAIDNGWRPPKDPNWKPEKKIEHVKQPESAQNEPETEVINEKDDSDRSQDFFKFLGYDRDIFYVFQFEKNQICQLKKGDLTETGLLTLAPDFFWGSLFPAKSGFDKKSAVDWFIRNCYKAGIFRSDVVRGRGAWWDDNRVVFHFGSHLWVDGQNMDVGDIESKYIYEVSRRISIDTKTPLSVEDGRKILSTAKMFRWQKPASAPLLCGWLMLARICGAINWRPHLWITGESGSGKSTIMDRFVYHLTGKSIVFAQGNSTEAGIRQKLKNDAIPVLFDESETNNEREQNRVQNILSLIRQSSSESGAQTLKGTATGDAMYFHIRSMFMLSSIQVQILMQADAERITVLPLMPKRQKNSADQWKRLERNLLDIGLDSDISDRIFARSLHMLPNILKNIEVFRIAAARFFGTVREGDQYGTLLAGCWSLCEDRVATTQDAEDMINKLDWSEYKDNAEDTESKKTLSAILESKLRIPHGEASLFEVISVARNGTEMNSGVSLSQGEAVAVLQRYGMKLDESGLLMSNNSQAITGLLRGSQYQSDWKGQISRVDGVTKHPKSVRFNGVVSRCLHIDFSIIGLN